MKKMILYFKNLYYKIFYTVKESTIEEIEIIKDNDIDLYNLEVKDNHNYFANNSLVSNCHYIKNSKSTRARIVRNLSKRVQYRFFLSGTPILNKPSELIPQLESLGRFEYFGGFWPFVKKYCGAEETRFGWDYSGATNLKELNVKLKEYCMIRRLKSEVLTELPDKQRIFLPVEIDNRRDYNFAKNDFILWIRNRVETDSSIKEFEQQLKDNENLTSHQRNFLLNTRKKVKVMKTQAAEALLKLEYLKQLTAQGKISRFKEWINNFLESTDEKIIIFSVHKDIQQQIFDYLDKEHIVAHIFSEDSVQERQRNIEMLQNDPKCRIMVASLSAAGVGITLTAANNVLFMEFGWTSAVMDQAEDRTHRISQKNAVNIYYFYGLDTIDEYVLDLINHKREVSNAIMDGAEYNPLDTDLDEILKNFI
jgi:SWI/SNF-related matrix-associated actin-dependent regulator 1 of chromatin subfamily A